MNLDHLSPRIGETRRLSIVAETVAEAEDLDRFREALADLGIAAIADAAEEAYREARP